MTGMGDKVAYIAALDFEHHIFLGQWHEAFPTAKVIGMEGLAEKRTAQKNEEVPFAHVFTQANKGSMRIDEDFDRDFEYEYCGSHLNKELVFNYRPDRTMIEADLIWNLPGQEQYSKSSENATDGILTKLFQPLVSTVGSPVWQKRFLWYAGTKADRPGFEASVLRMQAWDFDRIIPCHGDVIETGGKATFNKVMQWHLPAATAVPASAPQKQ